MLKEISKLNADNVICKVARSFPDSSTRLLGIYNLAVKVIRLDFPIGSKTILPDYMKRSRFVIGLQDIEDNLCFWSCIAIAEGCGREGYIKKSKELFQSFYKKTFNNYPGFDFVNELDVFEVFNTKCAINIINYNDDESIEYIRKSNLNTDRIPIYLILYMNHFCYVKSLEKVAKMYVSNRCGRKFQNN